MIDKKNATLVFAYGLKNSGDMAITIGAINQLINRGYNVKAISLFDKENIEYKKSESYLKTVFPELEFYESPFKLNREDNLVGQILSHLNGMMVITGLIKKKNYNELIKESDLVIFNGGNLFRADTITDYMRLSALTHPLRIAKKGSVPYLIFPQSAYKINKIGEFILNKVVSSAEILWAREEISYKYLKEKFENAAIKKSIDLAFFIDKDKVDKELQVDTPTKKICFTIRAQTIGDLKVIDDKKYTKIINVIEETITELLKNNENEVIMVVQSIKDYNITKEIYNKFRSDNRISIVEEYDPLKLAGLFEESSLLVGMRLHSIIVSLLVGTPAVGFFEEEWGFKNPGLMKYFGLPYNFIDDNIDSLFPLIEDVNNNIEQHESEIAEIINLEKVLFEETLDNFKSQDTLEQ